MKIESGQRYVSSLFGNKVGYVVPKYQRNYAWESEQIDDLAKDLLRCLEARKKRSPAPHFVGGILMVSHDTAGSSYVKREIVDGQQRLATFALLGRGLIDMYDGIAQKATGRLQGQLRKKAESLFVQYIEFPEMVELEEQTFSRLTVSKADQPHFHDLLTGKNSEAKRESHKRLQSAYQQLQEFLVSWLEREKDIPEQIKQLQLVEDVLAQDWTVLELITETRQQAYMLFQVLNDRGKGLTEGELLRAATLEILEGHDALQDKVADLWDSILRRPADDIERYLRWIYASHKGERPGAASLYDNFRDHFFPVYRLLPKAISTKEGQEILRAVRDLESNFDIIDRLKDGDWPYEGDQRTKRWEKDRLTLLTIHLAHDHCMPLLLAARQLPANRFVAIIQQLERFFFRYKIICNGHMGKVADRYHAHALEIRSKGAGYREGALRADLLRLLQESASDQVFGASLAETEYSERGSNKHIRYLLLTIEHYLRWYLDGARGRPRCKDMERVFDFATTSVEHIYPQEPKASEKNAALESVKHRLGNLTFLGEHDNGAAGNEPFNAKKEIFKNSSVQMNRNLAKFAKWTEKSLAKREQEIVSAAIKIFVP